MQAMDRTTTVALDRWAARSPRKPLIVRGARQVGKSWLIRHWGGQHFGRVVEINFERYAHLHAAFCDNDPRQTLARLELLTGQRLPTDGSVLLFLDEIQAQPEVIAKLRWFAEETPELPVIAAGSLLDFALADHDFSMPVGRVSFLHLEPMGFEEFCLALGEDLLVDWIRHRVTVEALRAGDPLIHVGHDKALGLARLWLLTGGMPAAVDAYRTTRSLLEVGRIHNELLIAFREDFHKYASRVHHARLMAVIDAVPQQLGRKFSYVQVNRDERAAALRQAVDLLALARVCHRVHASPAQGLPLGAGKDDRAFKLLHLDVGLASSALGLDLGAIEPLDAVTLVNKGAIVEQAVGQLLRCAAAVEADPDLYYWQREKRNAEAELDYVIAVGSRLCPIEVKAGATGTLRSLHHFMQERGLPLAVRVYAGLPALHPVAGPVVGSTVSYPLLSLPFYLTEQLPRLFTEALVGQSG
jgi:predicted AAA+ superfamily ATPase